MGAARGWQLFEQKLPLGRIVPCLKIPFDVQHSQSFTVSFGASVSDFSTEEDCALRGKGNEKRECVASDRPKRWRSFFLWVVLDFGSEICCEDHRHRRFSMDTRYKGPVLHRTWNNQWSWRRFCSDFVAPDGLRGNSKTGNLRGNRYDATEDQAINAALPLDGHTAIADRVTVLPDKESTCQRESLIARRAIASYKKHLPRSM